MGFAMKRVEIKGAEHIRQIDVYNIAFDQPSMAMPLVDLEATRQRLLQFGWVARRPGLAAAARHARRRHRRAPARGDLAA